MKVHLCPIFNNKNEAALRKYEVNKFFCHLQCRFLITESSRATTAINMGGYKNGEKFSESDS